jgi:hypothetical protein
MSKWQETINELRKEHEEYLSGVLDAYFCIKAPFLHKNERCITLYKSELQKGDVYLELVSPSLQATQDRQLYLWRFNPHWNEEYEKVEGDPDKSIIPIQELRYIHKTNPVRKNKISFPGVKSNPIVEVKPKAEPKTEPVMVSGPEIPYTDFNVAAMTIRDFVAIFHRRPVSKSQELNDLIKSL